MDLKVIENQYMKNRDALVIAQNRNHAAKTRLNQKYVAFQEEMIRNMTGDYRTTELAVLKSDFGKDLVAMWRAASYEQDVTAANVVLAQADLEFFLASIKCGFLVSEKVE